MAHQVKRKATPPSAPPTPLPSCRKRNVSFRLNYLLEHPAPLPVPQKRLIPIRLSARTSSPPPPSLRNASFQSDYPLELCRVREALRDQPHGRNFRRFFARFWRTEDYFIGRHFPFRVLVFHKRLQLFPLRHAEHLLGLLNRQLRVRRLTTKQKQNRRREGLSKKRHALYENTSQCGELILRFYYPLTDKKNENKTKGENKRHGLRQKRFDARTLRLGDGRPLFRIFF